MRIRGSYLGFANGSYVLTDADVTARQALTQGQSWATLGRSQAYIPTHIAGHDRCTANLK